MDYTLSKQDDQTYQLDPWPFKQEKLNLTFRYWSKYLSTAEKLKLKELCDRNSASKVGDELDRFVKTWWHAQENNPKAEKICVNLKPLSQKYLEPQDGETVYQKLAGFSPNPMQEEMFRAIAVTEHPAILLKAPTGTGKTESILFPALARGYRLFLPLPARSLLEDQKERIENYLIKFSNPDIFPENKDREISMVVDTGSQMYRWVYKNGKDITATLNINLRRHLYKGDVILTTIDKFLYRYFSFGDKQKSFIFPLRINQPKTLICFDEAHSYDEISFTNFQSLVKALYEAGRSLVLMTATMPPELAKQFDYLETIDYTTEFSQQPERRFEWKEHLVCNREEPGDFRNPDSFQQHFADIVVNEWKSRNQRSRIIAVAESVRDAAAIYQQLKDTLVCDTTSENRWLFLYHGRIAEQLRPKLYQAIKQRDDDKQPYIVVTTSAIEVGCDLNAEVLVSQICPPENLIQRAGRCNRKGNIPDAKVILVGDRIPDFANSLDEAGWQKYQETLRSLKHFDTQLISQCISRSQQVEDYRVVELFSMLHDYVYTADLTCQPLHKRGLIPTRSWKPSGTLVHLDTGHSISVPIDRFVNGQKYADIYAYEKRYDKEKSQWDDEHLLGWGSAYGKEITVRISPDGVDVNFPPYDYDENLGFVEIPKIFVKKWIDGAEEKLLYITGQHKAVISYIKSLDE
jgi:CRISPR-associated endonuclease/helicase Cas3